MRMRQPGEDSSALADRTACTMRRIPALPEPGSRLFMTRVYRVKELPRGGAMVSTLYPSPQAQVTEAEMRMGKQLVQAMTQPYQPENYRDEYEEKLLAAIQRKIDGQEITAAAETRGSVADLMEALQKSLEMQEGRKEPALAGVV